MTTTADRMTYTLRARSTSATYTAVTGTITLFRPVGETPAESWVHLFPVAELNDSRPQAECGARAARLLVNLTDDVPEGRACPKCQHALTQYGV